MKTNPTNLRITRSRTQLLLKSPFFGSLALKLKVVRNPDVPTMATDGYHLFYDEDFVESLTNDELTGVICHELLHCALGHMFRRGEREPKKWNVAADYAINCLLLEDFKMTLPKDRLYDTEYRGKSAEEIYKLLPDQPEAPNWGLIMDGLEAVGTLPEQEAEWGIALKQAAEAAKSAGMDIGGLASLIEMSESKVDWREQLTRLLGSHSKSDFTWMRPDPAYLYKKFIIPTLHAPSIGHLTFAIDTSGSVSDRDLADFIGELQNVLENVHFDGLTVVQCDTDIRDVQEYEHDDEINPKVHGRGGTQFQPVFDYIKENPTDGLIYFTDMYPCDGWPEDPGIPVFWARSTNTDAPYGNYIDLYLGA